MLFPWRKSLFSLLAMVLAGLVLAGCSFQLPFLGANKAGLQVITGDIPASVFLNGQYGEKTPFINKNLSPGEYTVKIQPDNPALVPHETTVTLTKGLLTVITWNPGQRSETSGGVIYEMEKLPDRTQTELSIISIPDRSIVSIDGQEKDFTPVILEEITPGEHQLEVSLPSYNTQQHTINLIEGHRINVTVKLAKSGEEPTLPNQSVQTATSSARTATSSAQTRPAATATPSARLSETVVPKPRVTIQSTNFFQNGEEVLRVRDQVGVAGQELGFAKVGSSYSYLGETSQGWYQIDFEGETGWVSGTYAKLEE